MTKTEQRPLNPETKAPGFFQYRPPMYSPCGPPPQLRMMPRMLFGKAVSCLSQTETNEGVKTRENGGKNGACDLHESNDSDNLD